jgi:hypothetical protein
MRHRKSYFHCFLRSLQIVSLLSMTQTIISISSYKLGHIHKFGYTKVGNGKKSTASFCLVILAWGRGVVIKFEWEKRRRTKKNVKGGGLCEQQLNSFKTFTYIFICSLTIHCVGSMKLRNDSIKLMFRL